MDITLGGKPFKTRKPTDLDVALLSTTGCNAAETVRQLNGWPTPGRIASALRPFLPDDAPSTPELADSIARQDTAEVLAAVKKLYADASVAAVAAPETAAK